MFDLSPYVDHIGDRIEETIREWVVPAAYRGARAGLIVGAGVGAVLAVLLVGLGFLIGRAT